MTERKPPDLSFTSWIDRQINEAAERGYIPAGACPGGHEPLVKPVAAVAGDRVTVTALGIAVNGEPIAQSAPLDEDSAGRPLRPVPAGAYTGFR